MSEHLDGGEAILEAFRALDIEYIMSSPGSEWGALWEALARQKVEGTRGPKYLSCWHETLAVDMALGYALVTGRMQAVVLHAGVGLLQGSVGLHSAQIQNAPMIVVSGEGLTYGEQKGFEAGHQWYRDLSIVGGPHRLVEPICKWSSQATSVHTLYHTLIRAGHMSTRHPMGPVYVNVPIEHQLAAWTRPDRMIKAPPPPTPCAPPAEIQRVAELLVNAKNPVITTEAAGRSPQSYAALVKLAEALAIPVVETSSSIYSSFPKDHPLHQGQNFKPFVETADVILVIRSRAPFYPTSERPTTATVVLIDENPFRPHMVYQNYEADFVLEGDVTHTLETLAASVQAESGKARIEERLARHSAAHRKLDDARLSALAAARKKPTIDPASLCAALSETLPADTCYVDEVVTHRNVLETHLRNQGPMSFLKVRGALGQGLGHAIGAKLAMPGRTVVSTIGDGSLLYNPVLPSLGYSAEENLPLLIVVFNNREYKAMRRNHLDYYPEGVAKQHGIYYGATLKGPDYSVLGEPFGGWGRKVENPAELVPAIHDAHNANREGRTAILNVILDA